MSASAVGCGFGKTWMPIGLNDRVMLGERCERGWIRELGLLKTCFAFVSPPSGVAMLQTDRPVSRSRRIFCADVYPADVSARRRAVLVVMRATRWTIFRSVTMAGSIGVELALTNWSMFVTTRNRTSGRAQWGE